MQRVKVIALFISLCLHISGVSARDQLPQCPSSLPLTWKDCVGAVTNENERRTYIGEFKHGKPNGKGTLYRYIEGVGYGAQIVTGRWDDGAFYETVLDGSSWFPPPRDGGSRVSYRLERYRFASAGEEAQKPDLANTAPAATLPNWTPTLKDVIDRGECRANDLGWCTTYILYRQGLLYVGLVKQGAPYAGVVYLTSGKPFGELSFNGEFVRKSDFGSNIGLAFYSFEKWVNEGNLRARWTQLFASNRLADATTASPLLSVSSEPVKQRQETEKPKEELPEPEKQNLQSRPQAAQNAPAERRVALIIGNSRYRSQPLKNPTNDARDMATRLSRLGFKIFLETDVSLNGMRQAVRKFADEYARSDVGLVYYSGHGIETRGRNYLIPVNADIRREFELTEQAYPASQLTEMFETIHSVGGRQRMAILVLDACRNNDLPRAWRSVGKGLARMDAPAGTFIAFATAPGSVAYDGTGRNSPFTKHLLRTLNRPNLSIEEVFKEVRVAVFKETDGEQVPWESSSLMGNFYFNKTK